MKRIKFRYKDRFTNGEWRTQVCEVRSIAECIMIYGLNDPDCEYEIISITEL